MKNETLEALSKSISGDIHTEKEFLRYYSVDASSYQITPRIVMFPRRISDIQKIIRFAKNNKYSITTRGAGTGLVGSALNSGIILDMKYFNQITVKQDYIVVGSGTLKANIDKKLESKAKFFPPNPSIGPYCSIGGMIGNNASGSHSLKYGSVIDNIDEITFVDADTNIITLPNNKKYAKKILEIAKKIDKTKFPDVTKNSCGYRLDVIQSISDTPKIIAGSEGTLGIVTSVKLKIKNIPKQKKLFIIEYQSINTAAIECEKILYTKPCALEFIDKKTLANIDFKFSSSAKCLLFVEYDSKISLSEKTLEKITSGKIIKKLKNKQDIAKWWRYRDSALSYSLKTIPKEKRIPHFIEDGVVPIKNLPKLFFTIQKINKMFHTSSIFYGHAGNANIHVRLLSDRRNLKRLKQISETYFSQIFRLGGSITGEHGDGLARSEFIKMQYGIKNYNVFKELKQFFDPDSLFNPGKVISNQSTIIKNLEKF